MKEGSIPAPGASRRRGCRGGVTAILRQSGAGGAGAQPAGRQRAHVRDPSFGGSSSSGSSSLAAAAASPSASACWEACCGWSGGVPTLASRVNSRSKLDSRPPGELPAALAPACSVGARCDERQCRACLRPKMRGVRGRGCAVVCMQGTHAAHAGAMPRRKPCLCAHRVAASAAPCSALRSFNRGLVIADWSGIRRSRSCSADPPVKAHGRRRTAKGVVTARNSVLRRIKLFEGRQFSDPPARRRNQRRVCTVVQLGWPRVLHSQRRHLPMLPSPQTIWPSRAMPTTALLDTQAAVNRSHLAPHCRSGMSAVKGVPLRTPATFADVP